MKEMHDALGRQTGGGAGGAGAGRPIGPDMQQHQRKVRRCRLTSC